MAPHPPHARRAPAKPWRSSTTLPKPETLSFAHDQPRPREVCGQDERAAVGVTLDERASRILYLFGALHEAKALELEDAKGSKEDIAASYRKAIDEWAKLVSKYPASTEASA